MALTPEQMRLQQQGQQQAQPKSLAPNSLAPLTQPKTTATTAPGGTATSTGGALMPVTGGSVPSPPQPLGPIAPAHSNAQGQAISRLPLTQMSHEQLVALGLAGQAPVDPNLQTYTPEQLVQQGQQARSQIPGANAYPWQSTGAQDPSAVTPLNPYGWQYEAAPGYTQQTNPTTGQHSYFDSTGAEWQPPGFGVWSAPDESGARTLSPWDGSTAAGGNATNQDNWLNALDAPPIATSNPDYFAPGGPAENGGWDNFLNMLAGGSTGGGASSAGGAFLPTGDLSGTAFGPGSNLVGTQISPETDPRLAGIQGMVDQAAQGVAQGLGDTSAFQGGPEAQQARGLTMQALQSLFNGPDRASLAADALGIFDERSAEAQQLALRNAGNAAAKFGRLGSGNVATSIGDYELARNRDRDLLQRDLALNAAQQTMADRQAQLSGALGVGDQMFGQDLQGAGFGLDRALSEYGVRGDQLGRLAGLENQQFGQGLSNRQELRGERDYQYSLSRDAMGDRLNEVLLEDQLLNSSFGRDQRRLESLLPLLTYDPLTGAQQNASDYYGARSADQQQALWQLLFNQGAGG